MLPDKIQHKLLWRWRASILGDSFPQLLPIQFSEYIVSAIKTFPKRLNIYSKMHLVQKLHHLLHKSYVVAFEQWNKHLNKLFFFLMNHFSQKYCFTFISIKKSQGSFLIIVSTSTYFPVLQFSGKFLLSNSQHPHLQTHLRILTFTFPHCRTINSHLHRITGRWLFTF